MLVESSPGDPGDDAGPMDSRWGVRGAGGRARTQTQAHNDPLRRLRGQSPHDAHRWAGEVFQSCRQLIARLIGKHESRIFGGAGDSVAGGSCSIDGGRQRICRRRR
jgi:hypothetical protein